MFFLSSCVTSVSSLYLSTLLLSCFSVCLFLFLSSLTSLRNWMVSDYYVAVRLTGINWIESCSISSICLSSTTGICVSFFKLAAFLIVFFLKSSVFSWPAFKIVSAYVFLSLRCPPTFCYFDFSSSLMPAFLSSSLHSCVQPLFFYFLLTCFHSVFPLFLLPPPPILLFPAHSFSTVILLSWWRPSFSGMNERYLIDETAWQREREKTSDGEEDKDTREEEVPGREKIWMMRTWSALLLTIQNISTLSFSPSWWQRKLNFHEAEEPPSVHTNSSSQSEGKFLLLVGNDAAPALPFVVCV